jgi:hypothetical protein
MPENFKCNVCFKAFKTNQHLTQHKNRKKKCHPHLTDMDNCSFASSITTTPTFYYPSNPYQINGQYKTPNNSETSDSIFNKGESILSNFNNINDSQNIQYNIQNPAMFDLFRTYKDTLDENKKLENNIIELKTQLMNTNAENILLRKKVEMVQKFIYNFQDFQIDDINKQ